MYRRTDQARRALSLAGEEAHERHCSDIGTEHMLLGLIGEGRGVAARALRSLGLSLEGVRSQVKQTAGRHAAVGPIQFGADAKDALRLAAQEALQGDGYVGTGHILLGLVRQGQGAAQILAGLGADSIRVRLQVLRTPPEHETEKGLPRRRAQIELKSQLLADGLAEAKQSTNPRARIFIQDVERRRAEARQRWEPALSECWWDTAHKNDVLGAYLAALDLSACDPEAAAAARTIGDRLAGELRPGGGWPHR